MELPEIGKQCSVPNCKQLDFLPFNCDFCKFVFCRDHFTLHVENCQAEKSHYEHDLESATKFTSYTCSEDGCTEKSIVPLICEKCKRHYCVTHRHTVTCEKVNEQKLQEAIERCNAPKIQFQEAKTAVDKQVELNLQNAKRKEKNVKTANKVQLMRLKAKATGQKSIPTDARLYFLIFTGKCPEGRPVFVSQNWTLGRCIDAVAEECKITNNNNKSIAPKLRLFRHSDKTILSQNMADIMDSLVKNCSVVNGESLFLDYVPEVSQ